MTRLMELLKAEKINLNLTDGHWSRGHRHHRRLYCSLRRCLCVCLTVSTSMKAPPESQSCQSSVLLGLSPDNEEGPMGPLLFPRDQQGAE